MASEQTSERRGIAPRTVQEIMLDVVRSAQSIARDVEELRKFTEGRARGGSMGVRVYAALMNSNHLSRELAALGIAAMLESE